MDGEEAGFRFLFDDEEQGLTLTVGPFHQKRNIHLEETIAQSVLGQFLSDVGDLHVGWQAGSLDGGEESQRLTGVIDDQILEVLIVRCGHEMSSEAGAFMQFRREEGR